MDALAGIMANTQAVAEARAADYAQGNRLYDITLTRPGVEPAFNRATGKMVSAAPSLVYSGPARIRPIEPGTTMAIADTPVYWASVVISIPTGVQIDPRIDDIASINDTAFAEANRATGRQFRVIGITIGGHLDVGFQLQAAGIAPSRWTTA